MSFRLKIICAAVGVSGLIVLLGIFSGFFFTRSHIEQTIEDDMAAVAAIADNLITAEINLLKSSAAKTAQSIEFRGGGEVTAILKEETLAYNEFISITLFDKNGLAACWGEAAAPASFARSPYVARALNGESVISSLVDDMAGKPAMYVCVPVDGGRAIAAAIPGLYFNSKLENFRIWESGSLVMVDGDGVTLADNDVENVLERRNFMELARGRKEFGNMSGVIADMASGKSGRAEYFFDGAERIIVYRPVTGSAEGWAIGAVVPVAESPLGGVRRGLVIVGITNFLLSAVAAIFISIPLARPFKKVNGMVAALEKQDKLLMTINNAAAVLLKSETDSFEKDLELSMDMLLGAMELDRIRIWKNYSKEDGLYCSLLVERRAETAPAQSGSGDVSYTNDMPGWEEILSSGSNINAAVENLTETGQTRLRPLGVVSLLITPVFFRGVFWGFVEFHNCRRERSYSSEEESILCSGGLIMAEALLRNGMTKDLKQARQAALASAEAKSTFLANMSHEMRTPLNAVIGLAEITLESMHEHCEYRDSIEKIYNSGSTLLGIINDILDLSKIESGKFTITPAVYSVPSLINDTANLNVTRIGSKPIAFHLHLDETLPAKLFGDELRIKQIFNNLLSNAFKYTKEGSVDLYISCRSDSGGGALSGGLLWLDAKVADTGIGIKAEDMDKLFGDYSRVDAKSTRAIEGTGLGLSITKRLAAMMDGTISVESEYGKGSVFSFSVRQGFVSAETIGRIAAENLLNFRYTDKKRDNSAHITRVKMPYAKVLVVDDIEANLDVAKGMMKPYGMHVDCVTSGQAAIDAVRAGEPEYDAVFMDHMMPGMDGVEALRIIREEIGGDYAKTVPVIALTANAIAGSQAMFISKGFQDFISKPIEIAQLDRALNKWVRDKEKEAQAGNGANVAAAEGSTNGSAGVVSRFAVDGLDADAGLSRFDYDAESYAGVLRSFARSTPALLDKLAAVTESTLPDFKTIVHGIKSSSRSIGAARLGNFAEELEYAARDGDLNHVMKNAPEFIEQCAELIDNIAALPELNKTEAPKQKKPAPDTQTIAELARAAENFDIDLSDKAMTALKSFDYERDGDLVSWLDERLGQLDFIGIKEKLTSWLKGTSKNSVSF